MNTGLLDASKAFDRVNHWTLFRKLLNRGVPVLLIQIIIIIKRLLWRQYPRKIRAQWCNETNGLGILVTMYNAKSRQPMDGGANTGTEPKCFVLNGVPRPPTSLMYQTVFGKVGFYLPTYLLYTLMI